MFGVIVLGHHGTFSRLDAVSRELCIARLDPDRSRWMLMPAGIFIVALDIIPNLDGLNNGEPDRALRLSDSAVRLDMLEKYSSKDLSRECGHLLGGDERDAGL
jgi:hypothetical protein